MADSLMTDVLMAERAAIRVFVSSGSLQMQETIKRQVVKIWATPFYTEGYRAVTVPKDFGLALVGHFPQPPPLLGGSRCCLGGRASPQPPRKGFWWGFL